MTFSSSDPVASAVDLLFTVLNLAILGRILLSWVDPSPFADNALKRVLWTLTEPILRPLRRLIPPLGMFDISPLVAIFLIEAAHRLVLAALGY